MTRAARIDGLLRNAVESGVVPGVVALAAPSGHILYAGAAGWRSLSGRAPMDLDTIFLIGSMTKALTATAAMQLVEQGRIGLDEPLGYLVPYLESPPVLEGFDGAGNPRLRPATRPITLRQLLTHTSGFSYELWDPELLRYAERTGLPAVRTGRLAALYAPLRFDPGERWQYGIGIDWVGRVIEAVSGMSLDSYLAARVYAPLGLGDTAHWLRPDQVARRAHMYARTPDGGLEEMPGESPQPPEFVSGGGGCYTTGGDYLTFLRMLLNGGRLDGAVVLRPETVALMSQNHIGGLTVGPLRTTNPQRSADIDFFPTIAKKWGLSFLINTEDVPGRRSAGSLSWGGIANTYFWIDLARGIAAVFLTEVLPFGDPAVLRLLDAFERAVEGPA
ncbi:MAG TPA: serine hydrolase domain-containing protein [bacterium]|nr:serine hydrolase domain-containing protein [bacterium]